jgi:hypothetical protein
MTAATLILYRPNFAPRVASLSNQVSPELWAQIKTMNILTRLKKMENQLTIGGEFCQCDENGSGKQKITWTDSHDDVLEDPSAVEAEYCGLCKKEINKFVIIVNYFSPELPI